MAIGPYSLKWNHAVTPPSRLEIEYAGETVA
jgi:hypothetical protein